MPLSVLDLFTIGIGPSSSHTVGPMRAACRFAQALATDGLLARVARVRAHLHGSLALTGRGHGTDRAVLLGLEGETPEAVDIDAVPSRLEQIRTRGTLRLAGQVELPFDEARDLQFHMGECLPAHPNGLRFEAFDAAGALLRAAVFYSIGGGFVVEEGAASGDPYRAEQRPLPFPFRTGDDLLRLSREAGLSISEMALANESAWRPEAQTRAGLLRVWEAMRRCVERGCRTDGILPGPLKVTRRAPRMFRELTERPEVNLRDPLVVLDWVSLWAMAVNEENAAGRAPGRVHLSTNLGRGLASSLEAMGRKILPPIGQRVAVAEAVARGLTIREYAPGSVAHAEFEALARAVEKIIGR